MRTSKPVAIIHIDTLRREYASFYLLANKLEKHGYKVMLTSRISTSIILELYRPDVLVITHTFTIDTRLRKSLIKKGVKVYVCIVEEVVDDEVYMGIMYRKDIEIRYFTGIFVWSAWAKNWLIMNTEVSPDIVYNIGSIRNSVLSRAIEHVDRHGARIIGLIGQFQTLNVFDGRHQFVDLLHMNVENAGDADTRYYFEKRIIDAEVFALTIKTIRLLIERGCNISIRPHPNESMAGYNILQKEFGDRLIIDKSIDLCEWLLSVDVIAGPVSSSYTEAYIMGIPIITFHEIQRYRYSDKNILDPLNALSLGAYKPKTVKEAVDLCIDKNIKAIKNVDLDEYLDKFYSFNTNADPVLEAIKIIKSSGSALCVIEKIKRPLIYPIKILVDFARILYSLFAFSKRRSFSVLRIYHYNMFLHRPTSFMKKMLR